MAPPIFVYVGIKVKNFSLGECDHVTIVYSGPQPHPVEGNQLRTRARDETHAAVFETPSKAFEARADRMERSRLLHVPSRDLSYLDFDISIRDADR